MQVWINWLIQFDSEQWRKEIQTYREIGEFDREGRRSKKTQTQNVHVCVRERRVKQLKGRSRRHTILIDNADLLPLLVPLHVPHDTLVAVVDHLLEPVSLVEHPHNDQTVPIT